MSDQQNPPVDQGDPNVPDPQPAQPVEVNPVDEQTAQTAGEQNHANVDKLRGEDADAPADAGKPAQEG
jgi:hypothetical protein